MKTTNYFNKKFFVFYFLLLLKGFADGDKPCPLIGEHLPSQPPEGITFDPVAEQNASFKQKVNNALAVLNTTKRGKELIDCARSQPSGLKIYAFEGNEQAAGNPNIVGLNTHTPDGTSPSTIFREDLASNCPDHADNSNDGGMDDPCRDAKDLAVTIGHELGHAVTAECGFEEDEKDGGKNVQKNENPIREELGLCKRTKYSTPDGDFPIP